MDDHPHRQRLDTEALVLGYAMSRLDRDYLGHLGYRNWTEAFNAAAEILGAKATSIENLRDEFDPYHPNPRRGWHGRQLRPSRERVLLELAEVSDAALIELASRILKRDSEATQPAIDALAAKTQIPANVAERLLTGRRAEEFFMLHCQQIAGVSPQHLLDVRNHACGYDFGVEPDPKVAFEVKGMKTAQGQVQFTDREWAEAGLRGDNYLVVVVGQLPDNPVAKLFTNPRASLRAECRYTTTTTAAWRSTVSVL